MSTIDAELNNLIAGGETLTVEFKSDRGPLPDNDLVAALVASNPSWRWMMWNSNGAHIYERARNWRTQAPCLRPCKHRLRCASSPFLG